MHGLLRAPGHRRPRSLQEGAGRPEALVLRQPQPGGVAEDMSDRRTARATRRAARTSGRPRRSATSTPRPSSGRYQIRGFSTFQRFPTLDDLVFLPAVMTRLPLEGYREHCETTTRDRRAASPISSRAPLELDIPDLPDVDELRRARHERQAGARHGLLAGRARDLHGRGRDAAGGARGLRPARSTR